MLFKQKLSVAGLLVGMLFLAFSLTPSMLPRTNLMQGLISGFAFTSGYGLGALGQWLWAYLGLPVPNKRVKSSLLIPQAASAYSLSLSFSGGQMTGKTP